MDSIERSNAIAAKLGTLRDELRSTTPQAEARQAKAMFETGAEVLGGLRQAFADYAEGSEQAWQR
jgi:hypothetical protein